MNTADHAQHYATYGWHVIPVVGKKPVGTEWQTRASADPDAVARLFEQSHDGIGVLIGERSGIIDFDIDNADAQATIERLFDGVNIETPFFQSARGKHYLFNWTDKLPQGSIKIVIDGLEIRLGNGSKGCQSVLPPSGNRTWINDPDDCPLAELPDIVIERINARYTEINQPKKLVPQSVSPNGRQSTDDALNVPKWLTKHGRPVIETTEGDGVTRFHIVCPGIDRHTTDNNPRDCCVTQSPDGKLGGCCFHASCGMRDWPTLRDAIGPLTHADFHDVQPTPIFDPMDSEIVVLPEVDDEPEEESPHPLADYNFPDECLRPPGLIGDFVDYTLGTAKFAQPEHTLAAGLSLMSLITGRRVADGNGTRTNLMIVSVGPTRSGKEHPRTVIKSLLEMTNSAGLFEEKLASEAALYGFLKMSHAGLLMTDEFGDWLALARSKAGPNTQAAKILTAMTMLYSSANCRFKAPRYAENSKQVDLNEPHLVFLGTSTGEVFWKHVTPEYLSGGLFGRIMVFENRGYVLPASMASRQRPFPVSIATEMKAWLRFNVIPGETAWEDPVPLIVPHEPDALERFESHEMDICTKRMRENAIQAALWSGTGEITAKLALLFACSRSRDLLQITMADVDMAIRLSNWLTRRKVALCCDHVAENAVEDAVKRVYRMIKAAGVKGVGKYELTKKTQWTKDRDRKEIIDTLLASGDIVQTEVTTKTKPKLVYLATINVGNPSKRIHHNPSTA